MEICKKRTEKFRVRKDKRKNICYNVKMVKGDGVRSLTASGALQTKRQTVMTGDGKFRFS